MAAISPCPRMAFLCVCRGGGEGAGGRETHSAVPSMCSTQEAETLSTAFESHRMGRQWLGRTDCKINWSGGFDNNLDLQLEHWNLQQRSEAEVQINPHRLKPSIPTARSQTAPSWPALLPVASLKPKETSGGQQHHLGLRLTKTSSQTISRTE